MWSYRYDPYSLMHYSSKYYDPKKAHEYYEQHKQLKGRTSTAGLNEEGKKAAAYVKKQINEERDSKLSEEEERAQKERELRADASKRTMEQHRAIMNQRISSLKNLLERMSPEQKKAQSARILATIKGLRDDNEKKRQSLAEKNAKESAEASLKTKTAREDIRNEATATYESELSKIASESQYQKTKKGKGGSKGPRKFTD